MLRAIFSGYYFLTDKLISYNWTQHHLGEADLSTTLFYNETMGRVDIDKFHSVCDSRHFYFTLFHFTCQILGNGHHNAENKYIIPVFWLFRDICCILIPSWSWATYHDSITSRASLGSHRLVIIGKGLEKPVLGNTVWCVCGEGLCVQPAIKCNHSKIVSTPFLALKSL